jgi:hypothetical protein
MFTQKSQENQREEGTRKKFPQFLLLKVLISTLLLLYLFQKTNFREMFKVLKQIDPGWFSGAVFFTFLAVVLLAWRWKFFLDAKKIKLKFWKLVVLCFESCFFNLFAPGNVGGDIFRWYQLGGNLKKSPEIFSTVIVERVWANFSLIFLFLIGWLFEGKESLRREVFYSLLLFIIATISFFLFFFYGRLPAPRKQSKWRSLTLEKIQKYYQAIQSYKNEKRILLKTWGISLCIHGLVVYANYLLALAFGLKLGFTYFLLIFPLINIAALVFPLSLCGLGIRENLYVFFFSQVGLRNEIGVLFSLSFFSILVLLGLTGLFFFLTIHSRLFPEKKIAKNKKT